MLTPQEVSERAFQRVNFGGGYNMAQVDEFLDVLTGDYTALYNENAVLKSKMKVLVDKVQEYRSTEEAMRKALMTAQRMADDMVKEAEEKKAAILREAEEQAKKHREELARELEAEEFRLQTAQQATASFVSQVAALQSQQSELLMHLKELCPPEAAPAPVDRVEEAASEIDDNVQRLLAKAMKEAAGESAPAEEPDAEEAPGMDDTAEYIPASQRRAGDGYGGEDDGDDGEDDDPPPHRRINFGKLQFGRDYEIK